MIDKFRLKLKIFLGFLLIMTLTQVIFMFFECNKIGFYFSWGAAIILIGYIVTIIGYVTRRYFGFISGIIVFAINLGYFYFVLIRGFLVFGLGGSEILLNLFVNSQSILITTFVYVALILYVISTKNYFEEDFPVERTFHKVMFVLLILAFILSLFIFYQNYQRSMEQCPQYTFDKGEMFLTPENALITDTEAYYNKDTELFWETAYHSDSFKEKLSRTEISFEQFKEMERQNALSSPKNQRVDRIEFTKKETINENEVYLEYRVFLKILNSEGILHSKDDFAYMIKVGDKWKLNVEPEFDPQFKEMGVI